MASPTVPAGTGGEQNVSGASAATFVPSKPTGTVSGNVLLAIYYLEATTAITMPTGFTSVLDVQFKATGHASTSRVRVDWKIADGSEGATLSWSWTGSQWRVGTLICCQGTATSGTPVEQANSNTNNGGTAVLDTSASSPTVALAGNTTVDGLLFLASANSDSNTPTWAAPASWTLRDNSSDDIGVASIAQASGGAPAATRLTATDPGVLNPGNAGAFIVSVMSPSGAAAASLVMPHNPLAALIGR